AQYGIALPNNILAQLAVTKTATDTQVQQYLQALASHTADATGAGNKFAGSISDAIAAYNSGGQTSTYLANLLGALDNPSNRAAAAAAGADLGGFLTAGIGTGMTSGSALQNVEGDASHVVAHVLAAAKAAAQSHSPSQLFANEVGLPLTQGIAQGMTSPAALTLLSEASRQAISSTVGSAITAL